MDTIPKQQQKRLCTKIKELYKGKRRKLTQEERKLLMLPIGVQMKTSVEWVAQTEIILKT